MNDGRSQNSIYEALARAAETLRQAGVAEPRREASSLLTFVLDREPVFLIAHREYELTKAELTAFESVISRRSKREPFQYIVRRREFFGLEFAVSPDVLIPRPETEILVEDAIATLSALATPKFFEVGVGTGCISISILHHVSNAAAVGADISAAALSVAAANAELHGVTDRLSLIDADVYSGVCGQFDLIVSNPPYIPDDDLESLQAEVGQFEPHVALFGGRDGLDIVRRLVTGAPAYLKPGGAVLIEIGCGQSAVVRDLFDIAVWDGVGFLDDLQGIPRIARAQLIN